MAARPLPLSRHTSAGPSGGRLRRTLGAAAAGAVALAGLQVAASPGAANPAGTGLVISEVYGAGGNSGAVYDADFVELFNPTAADISLSGMSVQYRSSGGTSASVQALAGTVPAGAHFLVQMSGAGANGAPLPEPDQVAAPAILMAGTAGQVFLATTTTPFVPTGDVAGSADLWDMVGYGAAGTFETANTGVALNASTSASRDASGTDTDHNADDFTEGAPTPENDGIPNGGGDVIDATIAEIQGTDAPVSPLVGETVRTTGVVTAVYPTGGFNGFYLQTQGTGGGADATPGASDAVFVFGSAGLAADPQIGDLVEVEAVVTEFGGMTELEPATGGVTVLPDTPAPVTALATAYPTTEEQREAHEGELLAPTDDFVVTNNFPTNQFAEVWLATGDTPLLQPTDVAAPGTPEYDAVVADNAERKVVLDDGASINFLSNATNKAIPLPWLSPTNTVRVGAAATLQQPVVLDYRNNAWKFQPTQQVTDDGADVATFADTRTPAPEPVGGDLRLATFNVLNYFNTTGADFVAAGGTCTYFTDRDGDPVANNSCTPDGPRGAAEAEDLTRQQDKIVAAVNALGADVVSLEEIENSVKLLGETDRDDALAALVDALNAAAGSTRWAFVPSPDAADLPELAEQDVIRTAFIYNPATVELVGGSRVLVGDADFANAREPLAQVFKATGGRDSDGFAVVVNHLKSKSDSSPPATGDNANGPQGAFNGDRTRQATDLVAFADAFAAERGVEQVFLTGDFNAYTQEDPMQVLYDAGYTKVASDDAGDASYSFSGLSGSLDHVLANDAALAAVTGADIWEINANESVAFEYSRHNYNVTDFYAPDVFRASDHNPEVVGLTVPEPPGPVTLNLLGVNDFHGRINANTVKWAGTVEKLTADAGDDPTLLVGAGDLIGASEFASAVQQDQPTIDVLNALGLDASAVGNHEFDQGWADLRDRVIGPAGSRNAEWEYLGANVYAAGTTDPVLPEYALFELDGVTVGVIGAVTEETGSLVSPGGIADIEFGNAVDAVNRVAAELSDGDPANGEAQVLIASFHAGAQQGTGSSYEAEVAKGGEFAEMADLDPAVDVIFNGHTHQVYAWDAPIPGGAGDRPILQTGQYADNVGQVTLTVDPDTGDVISYAARNVARLTTPDADLVAAYPRVAQVKQIVDDALDYAADIGNTPVGEITDDITRAFSNGSFVNGRWEAPLPRTEDRLSESTLGDLVANALRDGIPGDIGDADLGIVNPGGLRADLVFAGDTTSNPDNTDGVVTYAEANAVLPFINNIWLVDLTGAELKQVLEQQWQTNPGGPTPSRPFLHLGLSDNVQTTLDPTAPEGSRVTSVTIDGAALDPAATYTVSTFSFLGTGGDNFRAFTDGEARDTGLVDRDLWIGYLEDNLPVAPDFARQQVYEADLPAVVYPGQQVSFTLQRLDLTSIGSPANTTLQMVASDGATTEDLGEVPVSGGTAAVSFQVPATMTAGAWVELTADPSGTTLRIPVGTPSETTVSGTADPISFGQQASVDVSVTPAEATGTVEVYDDSTLLGSEMLAAGSTSVTLPVGSLEPGTYSLRLEYLGDPQHQPATGAAELVVSKGKPNVKVSLTPKTATKGKTRVLVKAAVRLAGIEGTGTVTFKVDGRTVKTKPLKDGKAQLRLTPFGRTGQHRVKVVYSGSAVFTKASATAVLRVKR